VAIVLKSGSLNLLERSGPVQGCNGIALPSYYYCYILLGKVLQYFRFKSNTLALNDNFLYVTYATEIFWWSGIADNPEHPSLL